MATDLPAGLNAEDRDAYVALEAMLRDFGLDALAPKILGFLQEGFDSSAIKLLLQDTDEWKTRFAGNEARRKAGLAVLSPAEYLATEQAYRSIMQASGMPAGFYDQPEDFAGFIGNGVSPSELKGRVDIATDFIRRQTDPEVRNLLKEWHGIDEGHLVAFALDQKRGLPMLEDISKQVSIGAAAARQGLSTTADRAMELAQLGVSEQQAEQGFAAIGEILPNEQKLARVHDLSYSQKDAEEEVFLGLASAKRARKRINDREESAFGGSGGLSSRAFDQAAGRY